MSVFYKNKFIIKNDNYNNYNKYKKIENDYFEIKIFCEEIIRYMKDINIINEKKEKMFMKRIKKCNDKNKIIKICIKNGLKEMDINLFVNRINNKCNEIKNSKKLKINEELLLILLVNNGIIQNGIINRLIELFSNIEHNMLYFILIVSYIWLTKNDKLIKSVRDKLNKSYIYEDLFQNISTNYSLNIRSIL